MDLQRLYSANMKNMKRSAIRELLKLANKPGLISFAGGLPDPGVFPLEAISQITAEVLAQEGDTALQYGLTAGEPRLRRALAKWGAAQGLNLTEENVIVTTASQQGLELISKMFLDPGDIVIVELPSYLGGLNAFTSYRANLVSIPLDDEGMKVDLLSDKLKELQGQGKMPKFIYVVPDFQNPAGVTMSTERRRQLLDLCYQYDLPLVEDTPYRELRFEGQAPPDLLKMDDKGHVISLHTFSKILFPGMRLGWTIAPREIIDKLELAKQSMDLCTPSFTQALVRRYMERGLLEPQIERIIGVYRKKRDAMLGSLDAYMPKVPGIHWTRPKGGLFLWVTLPKGIDTQKMFAQAVDRDVAYVIGSAFCADGSGENSMRLNFSFPTEEEITEGIRRLAETVKENLA
ncbi:MAG: aminotransferase [candidate division Zixibacteria bacterium SM23_81]|nr:MAG: aminotransferase [candidate division Zixibacteria bacterium SM23_81]